MQRVVVSTEPYIHMPNPTSHGLRSRAREFFVSPVWAKTLIYLPVAAIIFVVAAFAPLWFATPARSVHRCVRWAPKNLAYFTEGYGPGLRVRAVYRHHVNSDELSIVVPEPGDAPRLRQWWPRVTERSPTGTRAEISTGWPAYCFVAQQMTNRQIVGGIPRHIRRVEVPAVLGIRHPLDDLSIPRPVDINTIPVHPLPTGIAVVFVLSVGASITITELTSAAVRSLLQWHRRRRGRCGACGYALSSPGCPECGASNSSPREAKQT